MKTFTKITCHLFVLAFFASLSSVVYAQGDTNRMYGDTIFFEDFGYSDGSAGANNTSLENIGGLGQIGSGYNYNSCPSTSPRYAIVAGIDVIYNNNGCGIHFLNKLKDHTGIQNPTDGQQAVATVGAGAEDITPRVSENGRMLYIDLKEEKRVVYKRHITELCRQTNFEFAVWIASIHEKTNGSHFRLEIWDKDPEPTGVTTQQLADAAAAGILPGTEITGGAKLLGIAEGKPGKLATWYRYAINFQLEEQDDCWIVLRNYGGAAGNDIVIDDFTFRAYTPFELTLDPVSNEVIQRACEIGMVTMYSRFSNKNIPANVDLPKYAFYFEGKDRNGQWIRLGSEIPIQVQSVNEELELTLPLAEYNLYTEYRLAVAATPAGFGGKCVTMIPVPIAATPLDATPQFMLSGEDVCVAEDEEGINARRCAQFGIKFTNQTAAKEGWQVKVRTKDGKIITLRPEPMSGAIPEGYGDIGAENCAQASAE
ncbi:MAG: hypothetical protein LBR81_08355 [Prevotellaceae bacterium]|jgi:hypothetical protein|nr:hypothetical protein [Prevotellaceae bacterium]